MWAAIFGLVFVAAIGAFIYLCRCVCKFMPECRTPYAKLDKPLRIFISAYILLAVIAVLCLALGYINAILIVIHSVIFMLLSDLLFFVVRKIRGKRFGINFAAILALATTAIYLSVGYALANNVWIENYELHTDKAVGSLRVVMFADSHVGTTFDGKEFAEYVKQMQDCDPDVVVIAGDYVDDDTSREDMIEACRALGTLKTTYGVYYAFGNHDKGYYEDSARGYSGAELIAELRKNNVTVLQDEAVLIDERFYIIGRQEAEEKRRGTGARAEISDIVKDIDRSKYSIVINHQPTDYDNEAEAGVDLVLSGHTHGGQMFPIGLISDMFGMNDRVYGHEKRNGTDFIVTSGISDWAFKFKTGCRSEFVVVDIKGE